MLINCWILDHDCSFFLNKTFRWFKYACIKKWTYEILQDFIAWPKRLETGTTKTEKSCDRNDSDRNGSDRIGQTEKSCTLPPQHSSEEKQAWK